MTAPSREKDELVLKCTDVRRRLLANSQEDTSTGCIIWQLKVDNRGYGRVTVLGQSLFAHRAAYIVANGLVDGGLVLDHLCRNRACVNPSHLQPVTNRENILRGVGSPAVNSAKVICASGHELSGSNLYVYRGMRICKACNRRAVREYKARRAAEAGSVVELPHHRNTKPRRTGG